MITVGLLRMTEFVDPDTEPHGPYRRLVADMFAGHDVEVVDIGVVDGDGPASIHEFDGWVISGSPASVDDDEEWIRTAEQIVRDVVAAERPLLGICFGHQLIAQALGGRVERAPTGWGVGPQRYETTVLPPWLAPDDHPLTILAMHRDQVVEAPSDAVVWSTADYCPNAGMMIGERTWTIQGHPEFTPALVGAIAGRRRRSIGTEVVDRMLPRLATPLSADVVAAAAVRLITGARD